MKSKFPYVITAFGILITLSSLLADVIGLGKKGIQAAQIFGVEIGVAIALMGAALIIFQQKRAPSSKSFWSILMDKVNNLPSFFWIALGILPAFLPFFIFPMFFGPNLRIHYPRNYLPALLPIGHDLQITLKAVEAWLQNSQTSGYVFTPLANVIFAPLLLLSYAKAYFLVSMITLVSYFILILLALLMNDRRNYAAIVFIATISFFSYGLQFELERGQSYTVALMLLVLAIYIFHRHPDFRLFAYLLFCISIQLKFFPALFIVMFVDDWRDWKANLKRFIVLGFVNFLLLFLFGFSSFLVFYNHMVSALPNAQVWTGNHSISAFAFILQSSGIGLFNGDALIWIQGHIHLIENALYLYFGICFLFVLVNAWLKNARDINIDLLLVCVIGSMVLTASHDYTLPMLTLPFAMFISDWPERDYPWARIFTNLLMILISFTYALTLFPYTSRPIYFQNSMPMLFVILTAVTLLNITQRRQASQAG